MSAALACINCGSESLTVGLQRHRNVPVHYCPACGFYCAFGMTRELACAMLATRDLAANTE